MNFKLIVDTINSPTHCLHIFFFDLFVLFDFFVSFVWFVLLKFGSLLGFQVFPFLDGFSFVDKEKKRKRKKKKRKRKKKKEIKSVRMENVVQPK